MTAPVALPSPERVTRRVCRTCLAFPCMCQKQLEERFEFSLRAERCACQGAPIYAGGQIKTVAAAITRHQQTTEHAWWRRRHERRAAT